MRYYFKLTDGEVYDDNEGVDLLDTGAAESEATRVATEWMRDNPDTFLEDGVLKVEILDETRSLVATIDVEIRRTSNVRPLRASAAR